MIELKDNPKYKTTGIKILQYFKCQYRCLVASVAIEWLVTPFIHFMQTVVFILT